ncbi:MAG: choice-of-anchor J domain-containing protein [Bacteroidales bacterium]|nr:choice-of-anchor J domain-containing protein [Bacteroidales bacterium]
MKSKKNNLFIVACLTFFLFFLQACKEDEMSVPLASTQADFVYEVNELVISEDTVHFQVQLTNKSLNANAYHWDFGNGLFSSEENPVVTYTTSGKYSIVLTVTAENADLYYNNLSKSVSLALGKQVLLFEDFGSAGAHLEDDSWAPEGWQAVDSDGDGYNWYASFRISEGDSIFSVRSQSWDGDPLTPDNWLITPEINLSGFAEDASATFRFTVGITANTPQYRKEHYGVFIAVGSSNISAFELLLEETFTEETPRMTPLEREIDISAYAGNIVFLAIRHFNVTDMDRMFVEEVELFVIE